ncbi:MAG: DNA gyrase inhibitor YacG [Alphaproteobacteria bacterium]|nr:MAG: DNA gyrase inhibitor YacG [Alphaproteobacteria bacterium]
MEDMSERELCTKQCPTCGKPAADPFRPFCSRRCANVDLNRWLSGVYAVPVKEEEDEDGTPSAKGGDEAS